MEPYWAAQDSGGVLLRINTNSGPGELDNATEAIMKKLNLEFETVSGLDGPEWCGLEGVLCAAVGPPHHVRRLIHAVWGDHVAASRERGMRSWRSASLRQRVCGLVGVSLAGPSRACSVTRRSSLASTRRLTSPRPCWRRSATTRWSVASPPAR
jgi:hypothetical protein